MRDYLFKWSIGLLCIFVVSMLYVPRLHAVEGRAVSCGCYCGVTLSPPCSEAACKRACGWKEPSGGGGDTYTQPSYDYEAEHQRQIEIERQRQQELQEQLKREEAAAKKRQEEFERNKQEALKSMKGITENELGLKGADSGGFGLKDISGKDKGGLGLKEIGDSSVVDLRDKKEPYVVDHNVVKGRQQKTKQASPVSNAYDLEQNARREEGLKDLMLLFDDAYGNGKKGIFPKNPNPPLINPLREPERWKAYDEASRARLDAMIKKDKTKQAVEKMMQDKKLNEARDRILKEENMVIYREGNKLFKETQNKFDKLDLKHGVTSYDDYRKKEVENPKYKEEVRKIADDYWNKLGDIKLKAGRSSHQKMMMAIDKFSKKYGIEESAK